MSTPTRLRIEAARIDTPISRAGLTTDGAMDIKKDPSNVAWYQFGARPGDEGSAVIAGHYGWLNGQGAAFNYLHLLKKGDKVTVYDKKDSEITFVVRESKTYNPVSDAKSVFVSYDGKSHLNLITCDGSWDEKTQSYTNRLVVFTDLRDSNSK